MSAASSRAARAISIGCLIAASSPPPSITFTSGLSSAIGHLPARALHRHRLDDLGALVPIGGEANNCTCPGRRNPRSLSRRLTYRPSRSRVEPVPARPCPNVIRTRQLLVAPLR